MKTLFHRLCIITILLFSFCFEIIPQENKVLVMDFSDSLFKTFPALLNQYTNKEIVYTSDIVPFGEGYEAVFMNFRMPDRSEYILNYYENLLFMDHFNNAPSLKLFVSSYVFNQNIVPGSFWDSIGVVTAPGACLAIYTDYIAGVANTFTRGLNLDTTIFCPYLSYLDGDMYLILDAKGNGFSSSAAYANETSRFDVVLDFYGLIYQPDFLERVCEFFNILEPVGVTEPGVSIPDDFNLSQNYPNPFNPSTIIEYQIPFAGYVKIKIYDALGKEIKTLVNEFKYPGYYKIEYDAENLASGIYLYSISSGEFRQVRKMILTR